MIVESFERIHRSNLVGMGVLPLQFKDGTTRQSLKLDGTERFDILGIAQGLKPRSDLACRIHRADGKVEEIKLLCRIDTRGRARILPPRRHPAIRAAPHDESGVNFGGTRSGRGAGGGVPPRRGGAQLLQENGETMRSRASCARSAPRM